MKFSIKRCAIAVLAAAGIAFGAVGVSACTKKAVVEEVTGNTEITKTPAPTDGSLPTAHSGTENLAYIAAVLDSQPKWHSYGYTVSNASITTQVTRTWKDYSDGVLITSDVTYSSMVKSGSQTCTVMGDDGAEIYFRSSGTPDSSTTNLTATWDTNPPTYYAQNAFYKTYGLLQTELSSYIINEESVIESGEVVANTDGTYTQSFVLDPKLSTYYYQYGMKTRGGLAAFPEFESVTLSVTFDASWRVLSLTTRDVSKVNKGVVVKSVSDTTTVFSYGDDGFENEHFAYYDSYYRQYIGDDSLEVGGDVDEELVLDVTNILSNGFAKILSGGDQFKASVTLGNKTYVGYIFVGLDLEDIAGSINVKLSLGKDYQNQSLYVEYSDGEIMAYYGNDFALSCNLAETKLAIGELEEFIKGFAGALEDVIGYDASSDGADSDMISDLMNSFVLETSESKATLILDTDDLLGLGVGIDAKLDFGVSNNSVTFRNCDINEISIGGEKLNLSLNLKVSSADIISRDDTQATADLAEYIADVNALLSSDLIKVSAMLDGDAQGVNISGLKGLKVALDAYCDADGIAVGADVAIRYTYKGTPVSAKASVWYDYNSSSSRYGRAIITLTEINGKQVSVKVGCDIADLMDGITSALTYSGADFGGSSDSLADILNGAFSIDISSLLTELYADNAKIKVGLNIDEFLDVLNLNVGVKFGSCALVYERGDVAANGGKLSASLPAIGFNVEISGADGQLSAPDTSDCLDLSYVLEDIEKFANAELYKAEISFDGAQATGLGIAELAGLKVNLTAYLDAKNVVVGANAVVEYTYKESTVSADISVWYDNASGNVIVKLNRLNNKNTALSMYIKAEELGSAVSGLIGTANTDGLAIDLDSVIAGLLSADFNELLPELSNTSSGVNVSINADKLIEILGADTGITFGNIDLAYAHGEVPSLTASAPALGLNVSVVPESGTVELPDIENALNISNVLADIERFANAELYKAEISFDGAQTTGLGIAELAGLKANITVYLNAKNIAAGANAFVEYTYGGESVSADFTVWYDYDAQSMGNVYLTLNSINGSEANISVKCDISELTLSVEKLLEVFSLEQPVDISIGSGRIDTAEVIANILSADFNKLLPDIRTFADGASMTIDVDYLLTLLGVNAGIKLGEVDFAYDCNAHGLTLSANSLGLSADINTSTTGITQPKPVYACELSDLVKLINSTVNQVKGIIDEKLLSFSIDRGQTYIEVDGLKAEIYGEGEISWGKGRTYVALDLGLSLTETATDETTIKFVYMENPADNAPVIRLVINNVGIDVYPEDIELLKGGIEKIYAAVEGLLPSANAEKSQSTAPLAVQDEQVSGQDALMAVIFKALATNDWVEALGEMSLTFDENSLLLTYLKDNAISFALTEDGAMAVDYSGKVAGFNLSGSLNVSRGSANLISAIDNQLAGGDYNISSSRKEGAAGFTRLVYDFLFDAISSVTIDNILGSDTYTVKFELVGNNSNIAELEDVNVLATMYMTGEQGEQGKIAEADLDLDVKGVRVKLNVIAERSGSETYFYINLAQVLNFKLPDLKVMATQSSLYETLEVLISTVTDTDIVSVIGTLLPEYEFTTVDGFGEVSEDVDDATISEIADILDKLLNFNFSQAFTAIRVDDVTTATVDFDNIAAQLGIPSRGLGSAEAVINHRDHSIKSSAKAEVLQPDGSYAVREWMYLLSEKTARRDYSSLDKNEYINIEFLPDLLADLVKFATDDEGNIYGSFTLSGKISANLVSLINIQIDISTLTVSFNEGQGFYFTLIGQLSGGLVSDNTIGITYENGYLTLAKGLNSVNPEYKIMTFNYFIDHMFATDGSSTLNYLLGVSDFLWKTVVNSLGDLVRLDSGITTPEEIFLYAAKSTAEDEEISMYDFIEALRVVINGNETAVIGDYSSIESKLGISDNYYGFSLNAGLLTNDVLTELMAAVVRDDATGISGIKAYGAIQSYVSFNVDMNYEEGLTPANSYEIGTQLEHGKYAPSLYKAALAVAEENGVTVDFDHYVKNPDGGYDETFGCFSTNGLKTEYSHELYRHDLTIVKLDGTTEQRSVRHGSTVHTYDNDAPVYTADGFRLLYSYTNGGDVADKSFILNSDTVLYEIKRQAVKVYVVNGANTLTVNSFVGDYVPVDVNGLDAIDGPYYADGTEVNEGDRIAEGTKELWLYGTFAQSEVTVNCVKYAFDAATRSYVVSGKAAGFNDLYTVKGQTLVLENQIDGYPVRAIADYALANTDGKPVKNVVVPSNITTVGAGAFLDNYGMQSVVFLADKVTMLGDLKSKSMPFYGCSTVETSADKANEKTILNIYYNAVTNQNMDWTNFRIVEPSPAIIYYMYVGNDPNTSEWINYNQNGGGALRAAGSWDYVDYSVNADDVIEISVDELVASQITKGLTDSVYGGKDALKSYIEEQLSQYKNEYGQDKYVTEVLVGKGTDGATLVTVNVSLNIPTVVTMYSGVAMTYSGQSIAAGKNSKVSVIKSDDNVTLFSPEAVGYTFIGWAAMEDGQLVFVDRTTKYFGEDYVYYAIWGTSKVGTAFSANVNYGGTALQLPSGSGIDGRWYDANWNEVTSLSAENTILYTRSIFTITYKVSGNLISSMSDSLSGYNGTTSSFSHSFTAYEGQVITAERSSDKYSMTIKADGAEVTTITLKKTVFVHYTFKQSGADLGAITANGELAFTY